MSTNPLKGMATLNFFAADLQAARQWYTELLGGPPYFERPGYIEFRVGDLQNELGIIDSAYLPGTQSTAGRAGAMVHWHVDDLEGTYLRLLALKATSFDGPRARGTAGFVTASVIDPFGNLLGLMYNPHYLKTLAAATKGLQSQPT